MLKLLKQISDTLIGFDGVFSLINLIPIVVPFVMFIYKMIRNACKSTKNKKTYGDTENFFLFFAITTILFPIAAIIVTLGGIVIILLILFLIVPVDDIGSNWINFILFFSFVVSNLLSVMVVLSIPKVRIQLLQFGKKTKLCKIILGLYLMLFSFAIISVSILGEIGVTIYNVLLWTQIVLLFISGYIFRDKYYISRERTVDIYLVNGEVIPNVSEDIIKENKTLLTINESSGLTTVIEKRNIIKRISSYKETYKLINKKTNKNNRVHNIKKKTRHEVEIEDSVDKKITKKS